MRQVVVLYKIGPDGHVDVVVKPWDGTKVPEEERDIYDTPAAQADNFGFEYDELRSAVGGPIEAYYRFSETDPQRRLSAYCHEEGKLEGLPLNRVATSLWANWLGVPVTALSDVLVGPVGITAGPFDAALFTAIDAVRQLHVPGGFV